tara:strand:- start:1272 stop:3860 length:2589 start_codon:yes stop_codon:yes gene_type:complete
MGGVAGHLSHLYDNREMTFNEMKKILSLASSGDLVGTEKTDGYNIYLGFKDGQARYARNKGDMQVGGKSTEDLAARVFAGGEGVKKVYNDAFRAFYKAAKSLTPAEQDAIFGVNGEIFYNTEIQGPGASNLVNYDANVLSIHHGGHKMYDALEDKVINVDATENSKVLDKVIDRFESATSDEPFSVRRTAMLKLKKLDDDYDLQIALAKIKKTGFQGSMTIEQYLEINLLKDVSSKLPYFSDQLKQDIVDRVLKKTDSSGQKAHKDLAAIYKGFPKDQKDAIRNFVNDGNKYIKQAILPIEEAIHDFAVELLKGLQSAYILDNEAEVGRIKDEVVNAIKTIQAYQGEHSELAQDVLAQQLRKIKHVDNINTAVEGFVFQHGDQLYKFTGNFAPVNQLLGLFKYGRGVIPPFEKADIQEQGGDSTPEELARRKIAVIPGKFKPPHRGHLDMVKHYAEISDVVVILISPIPRKTSGGVEITRDKSKQIWQTYLSSAGLDSNRVVITDSPYNSPVQTSYELVAGNVPGFKPAPGDLIIPGASTKPDPKSGLSDTARFKKFHIIPKSQRAPGILTANVEDYAFTPSEMEGVAFSASDFRNAIDEGDIQALSKFIPQETSPELILDIIYDGDAPEQKKTLTTDSLYSLVEELMLEKWKAYSQSCTDSEGKKGSAVVKKSETGKVESCHTSLDKAKSAVKARYANYNEELDTPTERYRRGAYNEQVELDEGLKDLLSKAGDIARVTLARVRGNGGNIADIVKTLGIDYLDPSADAQKIIDTAELLQDISQYGSARAINDEYDQKLFSDWLDARAKAKQRKRKKVGWEKTAFLEEEELEEMSSMAGGAVAGHSGNGKKRKNSLIREEEP